MRLAVIRQRHPGLGAAQRCAVEFHMSDSTTDATWVFHMDLVAGGSMAEDDLEAWPCPWYARVQK